MTLTLGQGPLAGDAPKTANYEINGPKHKLLFHEFPRRVRAVLAGETVLDTRRGMLLHETGILPRLYVPDEDVNGALLTPTDHTTHCPFKGDASYWTVRAGDRTAENAVWAYPQPLEPASWLRGYKSLYFEAADQWFDEDEEIFGHLRDPYHRVDARRTSRRVRVLAGDKVIAESERPMLVSETGLPNRYYLPPEDVHTDLLSLSATTTHCPYKGSTQYWSLDGGAKDVAWSYPEPMEDAAKIAGHLSFLHDTLTVEVDGRPE